MNFGQHLLWWERLRGTLRRKDTNYRVDVFGGRGVSADRAAHKLEHMDYVSGPAA